MLLRMIRLKKLAFAVYSTWFDSHPPTFQPKIPRGLTPTSAFFSAQNPYVV